MTLYKHGRARDMRKAKRIMSIFPVVFSVVFITWLFWFGVSHAEDYNPAYSIPCDGKVCYPELGYYIYYDGNETMYACPKEALKNGHTTVNLCEQQQKYSPYMYQVEQPVLNELIVKFKPDVSAEDRAKLKHQFALQDKNILDSGSQVLVITDGTDVEKMKRLLKLDDRIERVEVNGYAHLPEEEHEQFVLPGKVPGMEK